LGRAPRSIVIRTSVDPLDDCETSPPRSNDPQVDSRLVAIDGRLIEEALQRFRHVILPAKRTPSVAL